LEIQNQKATGSPGPPVIQTTPCRLADAGEGSPNELAFSGTATTFCYPGSICVGSNCHYLVGSVPALGSTYYQPPCGPPYYTTTTTWTHKAWLVGPADADFDLTLMKEIKSPSGGTMAILPVAGEPARPPARRSPTRAAPAHTCGASGLRTKAATINSLSSPRSEWAAPLPQSDKQLRWMSTCL
jgi:hypothetical protein